MERRLLSDNSSIPRVHYCTCHPTTDVAVLDVGPTDTASSLKSLWNSSQPPGICSACSAAESACAAVCSILAISSAERTCRELLLTSAASLCRMRLRRAATPPAERNSLLTSAVRCATLSNISRCRPVGTSVGERAKPSYVINWPLPARADRTAQSRIASAVMPAAILRAITCEVFVRELTHRQTCQANCI